MLQQFFAVLIAFIIFLIAFVIKKIVLPIWRFEVRAHVATKLYDFSKKILEHSNLLELSKGGKIKISYRNYTLEFSNANEANIQLEKIFSEALEYYDKLGWLTVVNWEFKSQKSELIQIYSEIRTSIWEKQGI